MSTNIISRTAATALQERWERLRSHKRIISRIKLLVEWDLMGLQVEMQDLLVFLVQVLDHLLEEQLALQVKPALVLQVESDLLE